MKKRDRKSKHRNEKRDAKQAREREAK